MSGGRALLTCDKSAAGSPRITRSRTWYQPADRPARDISRPKLPGLNSLPLSVSASLSDYGHISGSNERFTERSNTPGASEDEFGKFSWLRMPDDPLRIPG